MNKTYKSPLTKSQVVRTIAEDTGLSRRDVAAVLNSLGKLIRAHVKPRSCGLFRLPGMLRISVVRKPATKARKGVPNPFRPGETMDVPAKPASRRVKVYALKGLRDMIS
ncbi:DNA-binding protein [Candidatus Poribacteria bacterium]|nr:DNA-binding protein [Candidatus Poribacteria bacterium]